jgi:hypothetical protein
MISQMMRPMSAAAMAMPAMIQPHGVELDDEGAGGAAVVVGASVVGAAVVGATVVGAAVVGAAVVGAAVVGAAVGGAEVVAGAEVVGGAPVVGAAVTVVIGPSLPPVVVGPASVVVGRRLVVGRAIVVGVVGRVIDVIEGSVVPPLVQATGTAAATARTAPTPRRGTRADWRRARGTAVIPSAATTGVTTRGE